MIDDVDLAQYLLRHIYVQSVGQLQAVHHHVRKFLADERHALRVAALQKALDCSREDAVRYILHIALHTKSEEVQDA